MKTGSRNIYILILVLATLISAPVVAEIEISGDSTTTTASAEDVMSPCSRLITACFSQEDGQKSDCFYTSSEHDFCKGTDVGRLARQRWLMSPSTPAGAPEGAPSFLGPKLVNKDCLVGFDSHFYASLLTPEKLGTILPGLFQKLSECTSKETSPELNRP
ncbi:MAG: hypothetical protein KDD70_08065 [Bdellovibrionales bacterium]|nr:hypothetical protein [Bdellovibrionales bacterium]